MRQNEDGKTVAAMDVLAPGIGEIIEAARAKNASMCLISVLRRWICRLKSMSSIVIWPLRYCSAGFGLGFERLVSYVTGMQNIRDDSVLRAPKSAL